MSLFKEALSDYLGISKYKPKNIYFLYAGEDRELCNPIIQELAKKGYRIYHFKEAYQIGGFETFVEIYGEKIDVFIVYISTNLVKDPKFEQLASNINKYV